MAKLVRSKFEFFHNGLNDQKIPDIVIDLKRVDTEQIKLWPQSRKEMVVDWLADCEKSFERFKKEIIKATKR